LSLESKQSVVDTDTVRDAYARWAPIYDLTFGRVLKDRSWKAFVADLPYEVDFQLRSTFRGAHPELAGEPCPALYLETANGTGSPRQLLGTEAIDEVTNLDDLRELVQSAVDDLEP
ncbi:MAG: hypothetical protein ACERLM_16585, partial [Acidimicrobiales bacterium]